MVFINIGYGNMVSVDRVVAIISPESAPIKRMIQTAREDKMLIDATFGRKTRSIIITDSQYIILSSLQTETITQRMKASGGSKQEAL